MTTAPNGTITDYPFPGYEVENPAGSPTVRITFSIAGQVVALKVMGSSTATYYLYNDRLGSTATMSTTGGGPVTGSTARYYPFGDWRTEPTAAETSRWYTGHVHDNLSHNDLGLIYMNACFYLPGVGRFVSADTIVPDAANPQSHNRYTYVLNQPLRLVDPTGHYYYDPACDCMVHTSNPGNEYPANLARGHGMAGFGSLKGGAIIPIEVAGGWTDQEFDAIMTGVGILCEPCDWAYAAADGLQWYDAIGLLPLVPASIGDNLSRFTARYGSKASQSVSLVNNQRLLRFSYGQFRENLARATGFMPTSNFEAHHVLPNKFADRFERAGFVGENSIHNPLFGSWVQRNDHQHWTRAYQNRWENFFESYANPTMEQILAFAKTLAEEYKFDVFFP